MMICPRCHNIMNHVYRFTPDRNYELDICKNCYFETKPRILKIDTIETLQDNTKHKPKEKFEKVSEKPKNKPNKKKRKKGKKKQCIPHM